VACSVEGLSKSHPESGNNGTGDCTSVASFGLIQMKRAGSKPTSGSALLGVVTYCLEALFATSPQ